jgi:hypothetical protein
MSHKHNLYQNAHIRNVANVNKPTIDSWLGEAVSLILELVEALELLEIHFDAFFSFFKHGVCTKGNLVFV